jgi:hypothetical protein
MDRYAPANAYAFEYSPPSMESKILKNVDGLQTTVSNRSMYGDTNWHTASFGIDQSGNLRAWIDGMLAASATDTAYTSGYVGIYGREQPYYVKEGFKTVYVRNWTLNEPSHGVWRDATPYTSIFSWLPLIMLVASLLLAILLLLSLGILIVYTLSNRKK